MADWNRLSRPVHAGLRRLAQPLGPVLRPLRSYYRPMYGAIALGTIMTLLVLLVLQGLPSFTRAELAAYDFQLSRRGNHPTRADIVFVGIDHTSIEFLQEGESLYPIPRHWMTSAINKLHRARARAIVIDLIYDTPSRYDAGLARAIKRAGNVVLADYLAPPSAESNFVATQLTLDEPVPRIGSATPWHGLANVPTDDDGAVRAVDLEQVGPGGKSIGSKLYPSLAVQAASVALHRPTRDIERGLPNHMLINFAGAQNPGDTSQTFQTHSFVSVAQDEEPDSLFRNKIVLIGCADVICNDIHKVPYGDMYGTVIEANAVNTILDRNPITPAGSSTNNLIILLLALITTIAAARFGIIRSMGATALVAVAYVILTFVLFDLYRLWVNLITPEVTLVLVFAAIMGLRFATEERQRRKTAQKFGLYVKPEIVEILVNAPEEEKALAGARRPISVLFVDIRGFTAMSELMEPEDVVSALDVYLEELTDSVQKYDGTVDKYVGDELMAIWNAPRFQPQHPALAVLAALDMLSRMDKINDDLRAKELPAVTYGIGINSGDAVVGEMGSSFRKQYDVIGDTVNTAARLCSAAGRGEIIISESTWELIGDRLVVEEIEGGMRVKGKRQALRTFQVFGLRDETQRAPEPAPSTA